jgi:16S rRNA processing protein RimM
LTAEQEQPADEEAPPPLPEGVSAGRVGRAHGLDGSFYVTRPRPRLLTLGAPVAVADRTAEIVRLAGTLQRPIVRLEGVDSRTEAEALRGMDLRISGGDAPALGEDEWWAHELEGCEVIDGQELFGTVIRLIELPSCEALEVRPAQGGEVVLVPLVRDAVRSVATAERRIEVDLEFLGLVGLGGPAERLASEAPAETPVAPARSRGDGEMGAST